MNMYTVEEKKTKTKQAAISVNKLCCKCQINIPSFSLTQFELGVIMGLFVTVIILRGRELGIHTTCVLSEHTLSGKTTSVCELRGLCVYYIHVCTCWSYNCI